METVLCITTPYITFHQCFYRLPQEQFQLKDFQKEVLVLRVLRNRNSSPGYHETAAGYFYLQQFFQSLCRDR